MAPERGMGGTVVGLERMRDGSSHGLRAAKIVNFGCGLSAAPSCLNLDGSPTVLLARLPLPVSAFGGRREFVRSVRMHHIRYARAQTLRFRRESLDGFYASHVLDQLSRKDCERLLGRCLTWLRPGGVLRVVLADLKRIAAPYVSGEIGADAFTERTSLSVDALRPSTLLFGHSFHRWMYDAESFSRLLERVDFRNVRECSFGESQCPELAELDLPARKDESFYVEANP
jgi:predicted SAM-dependent methyltransferase